MHLSKSTGPRDAARRRIRVGSIVRVIGVPSLAGMSPRAKSEVGAVFEHIRGQCKRVAGVDERGNIELSFFIRRGKLAGRHSVAIAPNLVLVQTNA